MGQGIVMLEAISLFYVFTCLVMPVVGYKYYNYENPMARLFRRFMQVPEQDYFGYALPALILFSFILIKNTKTHLTIIFLKIKCKTV